MNAYAYVAQPTVMLLVILLVILFVILLLTCMLIGPLTEKTIGIKVALSRSTGVLELPTVMTFPVCWMALFGWMALLGWMTLLGGLTMA